jgi:uncharacterized protein (DUF3084 family)
LECVEDDRDSAAPRPDDTLPGPAEIPASRGDTGQRDQEADRREAIADERERKADEHEARLAEREQKADEHERQLDELARNLGADPKGRQHRV